MEKYLQTLIFDVSELAHIKLEMLVNDDFTQIRDRLFHENQFDLFVTEMAKEMKFPAEFISMAVLLRDKTLAYKPEEMQNEDSRMKERNEIADLAYTILHYWSTLGDNLFPPYLKGVVEMTLLYNGPRREVES